MVPVKLLHFYQPTLVITLYAIFIGIYQELGGTSTEPLVLDWSDAQKCAVTLIFMVLVTPFAIHGTVFGIFKFRIFLHKRCLSKCVEKQEAGVSDRIHRDITATDVVLEDTGNSEFVDVNLNIRDDFDVKTSDPSNSDVFKRYSTRLYKSESDLRDYRLMNGFYCDFARCSRILHHTHTAGDVFYTTRVARDADTPSDSRGSQIIVVKGCVTNHSGDDVESINDTSMSDSVSEDMKNDIISEV